MRVSERNAGHARDADGHVGLHVLARVSSSEEHWARPNATCACGNGASTNSTMLENAADNEVAAVPVTSSASSSCGSSRKHKTEPELRRRCAQSTRAFLRSLFALDECAIAYVPPARTAAIMMVEMILIGIENNQSTAFRLGALYVGLSDPSGSLTRRLRFMGLTTITVNLFGGLSAGLVWRSQVATLISAFCVSLLAGLSPLLGDSPALFLSMKLGLALYAVNVGVNRSSNGYGGLWFSVFWTFCGSSISLAFALLPEFIGTREAVRTDIFKVWHGFGLNLRRWGRKWGTAAQLSVQPIPSVTLAVSATMTRISEDVTETKVARDWLVRIMESADTIRVACLCFSNGRTAMGGDQTIRYDDKDVDSFFRAVGRACTLVSFAIQFPWLLRYVPFLASRADRVVRAVNMSAAALDKHFATSMVVDEHSGDYESQCESQCRHESFIHWPSSVIELIRSETQSVLELVFDGRTWPAYSPTSTLCRRISASVPSSVSLTDDPTWEIRGYALRLAIAFTLATVPVVLMTNSTQAQWFPMTVALIMVPSASATTDKLFHRIIGTLLGLAFGALLVPLLKFAPVHIILLGVMTFAAVLFLTVNYAWFTFFITGWVYVNVVGSGASVGWTTLYRFCWTFAAAALILAVTYLRPPKARDDVGSKLSDMAEATGLFAQAVSEQGCLRRAPLEEETISRNEELIIAAEGKASEIRATAVQARASMLICISNASLSPSGGYSIDPYSLAPNLAADLVNAVVIPQLVYLITDGSADGLLSDFDQITFSEIERLAKRLAPQEQESSKMKGIATVVTSNAGRGPFSSAISSAHHRLDEEGIRQF
mmetsp:Transcript_19450/g.43235  ORF Transcript_19450/g.43235 Transcript_19450/m.43235 type:complete len:829 (-) Transcript_19450:193-2679(-)